MFFAGIATHIAVTDWEAKKQQELAGGQLSLRDAADAARWRFAESHGYVRKSVIDDAMAAEE